MHRHQGFTITGDDHTPRAAPALISAVSLGTCCKPAVCDSHYTLMAVHLAILALDVGVPADVINDPDVCMDEGVELLAGRPRHPPCLHHIVAVGAGATSLLRVHMLPLELLVHGLAIGGLHQPQPQQGQQQEQK